MPDLMTPNVSRHKRQRGKTVSRFNQIRRFVLWFVGVVYVLILSVWIVGAVLLYKAASLASEQDFSGGIKPVIERLWCGKPGCLGS